MEQAVKIVGVSDDLDAVKACEAAAQKALAHHASAARSQPYYLDITHPDANKAAVVEYLAKMYQLDKNQIATIGDMPNDVLMFEKSGLSIAMGQAADDVKSKATKVTATSENEGFAKAIEDFILA
jgi:hydroxymethylpyrimidine pyrophosphatase-like HAD family hydrolase